MLQPWQHCVPFTSLGIEPKSLRANSDAFNHYANWAVEQNVYCFKFLEFLCTQITLITCKKNYARASV